MSTYEVLANRVIEAIKEKKQLPWRKPWRSPVGPSNLQSGREYQGINFVLLSLIEFESPWFLTFKQAKALGGTVKKGEKGLPVVFWSLIEKRKDGEAEPKKIPLLRLSTVFNISQCEGLELTKTREQRDFSGELSERCEHVVACYMSPPRIDKTSSFASYSQLDDLVRVPPSERFVSEAEYYCTLFHELVHSTAHPSRLNRKLVSPLSKAERSMYSFEELVAEFGATFLCSKTGIDSSTFNNSIAYLQGWVQEIQNRPRMLVEAAGAAQKAVDLILGKAEPRENKSLESHVSTKGPVQQTEVA